MEQISNAINLKIVQQFFTIESKHGTTLQEELLQGYFTFRLR